MPTGNPPATSRPARLTVTTTVCCSTTAPPRNTAITLSTTVAPVLWSRGTNTDNSTYTNYFTNTPAFLPAVVFSNNSKAYTIDGAGKISGLATLYKMGPGKLTILTTNDCMGGFFLHGGTVEIDNPAALGLSANNAGPFYAARGGLDQVNINGATLSYIGPGNTNLGRFVTLEQNGGTIRVANSTDMLTLGSLVIGPGSLTKTGAGILDLNQNGDLYEGGTLVNEGVLRLSAAAAGFGGITLANGTTMELTNSFTLTNAITAASGAVTITVRTNIVASGPMSGSAAVTISNAPTMVFAWNGSNSIGAFAGSVSLDGSAGSYRFNNTTNNNDCTGNANVAFDLGTGSAAVSNCNGAGLTYNLGSLAGGANTILAGRITNSAIWTASSTYSIGAKGGNTAFDGRIMNGNGDVVSVVKIGSGRLCLNGINTYTGTTTVSNGTLAGSGTIAGAVTVESGATLQTGCSIGTLTVGGTVTLKSGSATVMELDRSLPAKCDKLVAPTINAAGTLTVNNIGPTLYNGSTFTLFSVPVSGFSPVSLPSGYTWKDNLSSSGSITVTGGGLTNPVPPVVTTTYSGGTGGTLTMTWPYENLGWAMYTNSVGLNTGASNWHVFQTSGSTNQISVTAEAGKNVYYMMRLP